ncbi:MAG: hypothetical protein JKX75_01175 [Gammaproteobacteria bacterium]|nr:hypothetical protein [Gammaproteobacteria bacterium]
MNAMILATKDCSHCKIFPESWMMSVSSIRFFMPMMNLSWFKNTASGIHQISSRTMRWFFADSQQSMN